MMRSLTSLLIASIAIVISLLGIAYFLSQKSEKTTLPTYFTYTEEELLLLRSLPPPGTSITKENIELWQEIMFDLVKDEQMFDTISSRLYAYFFTALRDTAFLSYNLHNRFAGSVDPISQSILCLFFAKDCGRLSQKNSGDPYSRAIAEIVLTKVKARMAEDEKSQFFYPEIVGEGYWKGNKPYLGLEVGSWKTWLIKSGSRFRSLPPPPPNDPEWKRQLDLVGEAVKTISDTQKISVISWSGGPATIGLTGQWIEIASNYMNQHAPSLDKVLLVQSTLAMAMADAIIAVFDSKYTFWVKRPIMFDSKLISIMPTPNYPTYPGIHTTISFTAATILSNFFPENKQHWINFADEDSQSRLWGGIDFPIDLEQGKIQGEELGRSINLMYERE